ncbi:MAG: hypothetical protein IAG13_06600, partial [Deltaproteobacteria bacterium]|nr:hypothetical protein [Nannocystaceae bacterium]
MHLEWPALERELRERLHSPAGRARAEHDSTHTGAPLFGGEVGEIEAHGELEACRARLEELDELEQLARGAPDLMLGQRLADVHPVAEPLSHARRGVVLAVEDLLAISDGLAVVVAVADVVEHDDARGRH